MVSGSGGMEYIRRYYGVPAQRNMQVTVDGKQGVIVGAEGAHLTVRFEGRKHGLPCHPTWRVTYHGAAGEVLVQYGD